MEQKPFFVCALRIPKVFLSFFAVQNSMSTNDFAFPRYSIYQHRCSPYHIQCIWRHNTPPADASEYDRQRQDLRDIHYWRSGNPLAMQQKGQCFVYKGLSVISFLFYKLDRDDHPISQHSHRRIAQHNPNQDKKRWYGVGESCGGEQNRNSLGGGWGIQNARPNSQIANTSYMYPCYSRGIISTTAKQYKMIAFFTFSKTFVIVSAITSK